MNEIGKIGDIASTELILATLDRLVEGKVVARRAVNAIRKLISDHDTNLADCTEAIDALIEERDALIEDTNMEVKCCRCGKTTMYYSIAPYSSRDDGEPICAECIDGKAKHRKDSKGELVDEGLIEVMDNVIERYRLNCPSPVKTTLEALTRIKQLLQSRRVVAKKWWEKSAVDDRDGY